jgi:hypothetical protein
MLCIVARVKPSVDMVLSDVATGAWNDSNIMSVYFDEARRSITGAYFLPLTDASYLPAYFLPRRKTDNCQPSYAMSAVLPDAGTMCPEWRSTLRMAKPAMLTQYPLPTSSR